MDKYESSLPELTTQTCKYAKKIHKIFRKHMEDLNNAYQTSSDEIDKWCADLIAKIKNHAEEQKKYINESYELQRDLLKKQYEDYCETAVTYNIRNKVELFEELTNFCEALTCQTVKLQYISEKMSYLSVLKNNHDQQQDENSSQTKANQPNDPRARRRNRRKAGDKSNAPSHEDEQPINPTNIENENSSSADSKKSRRSTAESLDKRDKGEDSNNTCFICFMIFPKHMKEEHRRQHIDQHL